MGRQWDLRQRTMTFAVAISDWCDSLPRTLKGRHVTGQLFRAATSVAANYRAACRARSRAEFIAKLGIAIEESDESEFWLDFAAESKLVPSGGEKALKAEASELTAIFTQSQKTARANM